MKAKPPGHAAHSFRNFPTAFSLSRDPPAASLASSCCCRLCSTRLCDLEPLPSKLTSLLPKMPGLSFGSSSSNSPVTFTKLANPPPVRTILLTALSLRPLFLQPLALNFPTSSARGSWPRSLARRAASCRKRLASYFASSYSRCVSCTAVASARSPAASRPASRARVFCAHSATCRRAISACASCNSARSPDTCPVSRANLDRCESHVLCAARMSCKCAILLASSSARSPHSSLSWRPTLARRASISAACFWIIVSLVVCSTA
mmetsp:Transcript_13409/g.34780  ORF Transcript_13409/g.34780 Transcript_13409/m.34780 type:complete len:263 (+) Transcript_13409:1046-1834(+)